MKMTTKMEMNIPLLSMKREIQARKPRSVRFFDPLTVYVRPKIFNIFLISICCTINLTIFYLTLQWSRSICCIVVDR